MCKIFRKPFKHFSKCTRSRKKKKKERKEKQSLSKIIFKHNSKKYLYNFDKTVGKKWAKFIATKL